MQVNSGAFTNNMIANGLVINPLGTRLRTNNDYKIKNNEEIKCEKRKDNRMLMSYVL